MKRLSMMLTLLLVIMGSVFAEDKFTASPVTIKPGETVDVAVDLSNKTKYTAFQFDLKLPKGITISKIKKNNDCLPLDVNDEKSHTFARDEVANDDSGITYRILFTSTSTTDAFLDAAPMFTLTLAADKESNSGTFSGEFLNVSLSEPSSAKHVGDNSSFSITVEGAGPTVTNTDDKFSADAAAIKAGETADVALDLSHKTNYTAFQFDIRLPKGITLTKTKLNKDCLPLNSDGETTHSVTFEQQGSSDDNGTLYRVFSNSIATTEHFKEASPLLTLTIKADENVVIGELQTTINNLMLSDSKSNKYIGTNSTIAITTSKEVPATPEAYAALSEGNTVLTFYYDTKKAERGGMNIAFLASQSPWRDYADKITTVTITREMSQYTGVTSTAYWFYGMENLTTINGLPYLYTANVMYMNNMFGGCKNLASVDLSNFSTNSATMIDGMFADCGLTSVDLSTFNTSKVTSVAKMFAGCDQLKTITFGPEFSLPKVTGTGLYVFQTPALKEIVINRDVPVVPSDFFSGVGSELSPVKLTVPEAYLANYKARMTDGKLFGGYFRFGDEEVVDLTAQKDELLAAIKQQQSTLNDLKMLISTQQNSLSNTLTQMSTRQEALSRAFTKAQNELANAEISDADRSTLNSMLSAIKSAVQYATQLLANLTQGLQTDLPRLTERLQSADEYIYKVKAGVQSATTQADIDQAKTMMKQSMTDVSDLASALKNLATQTANSQTELDNSQNSIEDKLNEFNQKLSNAISNSGVEIQLDGATFAVNSNLYTVELTKASATSDYYEIPLYVTYNGMEYLVTAIGSSAFENSNVEVVIIPAGVEMIGPRAFANCYRLREIYSYSKVPSYYANLARQKASTGIISVFENVDVAYCTLYVPAGCVMRYRTSPLWSQFSMITELNRATDVKPTWVGDGEKADIYDLKGRKVREGVTSLEGLPKGVYVVNGKKMVVR